MASLFNSDWTTIAMILTGVALTYGTRVLPLWMFEKV
ncbi:hypothetical protein NK6_2381 [Bradyrhizobium diazoefficiens]|uniref:Uncharacterized protein n=1 Tax=Bradyrhizobium diazoefficiens TaxID=1355477 RepID=A0A0E4FSK3_9BRAD|nr:hypothetical protein NK6_2381 [Bradyrhizobium diazoefficiens]